MSQLDTFQQVFGLSLTSNALNDLKGTQKHLQHLIQDALPESLEKFNMSDWSVSWGPTVWKKDPDVIVSGPGNTWFTAHNPSVTFPDGKTYDTHVVSIAGTASWYDWIFEDFVVNKVVDFTAWVKTGLNTTPVVLDPSKVDDKNGTYIAYGTAAAVFTLLNTVAPPGSIDAGTTIMQYLSKLPSTSRVVFTGHSLGGALSPTTALALMEAGTFAQGVSVLVFATAGPTPGNTNFSDLYASHFPLMNDAGPAPHQAWNGNFYNALDIVPMAWDMGNPARQVQDMISVYGKIPIMSLLGITITGLIKIATFLVNTSRITYTPLHGNMFAGDKVAETPRDMIAYRARVSEEHIDAYQKQIGVYANAIDIYPAHLLSKHSVEHKTVEEKTGHLPLMNLEPVSQTNGTEGEKALLARVK